MKCSLIICGALSVIVLLAQVCIGSKQAGNRRDYDNAEVVKRADTKRDRITKNTISKNLNPER